MKTSDYMIKMESYRERLPLGLIPFIMARNPSEKKTRLSNILKGITKDESIFLELEEFCVFLRV